MAPSTTIYYPVPELMPDPRARFIQIMNTCHALALAGAKVKLVTGLKKDFSEKDLAGFYGLPANSNFEVVRLPVLRGDGALRVSWHGLFNILFLSFLLREAKGGKRIIFLRHIKLARFLLKFKSILKAPFVFEAHEIFSLNALEKKRERVRKNEYLVYGKADAVITISGSLKKYLADTGVDGGKIHVVHDGVRKDWFAVKRGPAGNSVCYTGSLYPWKGVDVLISAAKLIGEGRIVIVGGGSRLKELKERSTELGLSGRVEFAGAVPHSRIPEFLSKAAVAVLPNIDDGPTQFSSPLKLFEYMACGVPVVASGIPAFREVLTDGKNALLFKAGDPADLAQKIRRLIGDPGLAQRLAEAARRDAEGYSYEARAKNILRIAESL